MIDLTVVVVAVIERSCMCCWEAVIVEVGSWVMGELLPVAEKGVPYMWSINHPLPLKKKGFCLDEQKMESIRSCPKRKGVKFVNCENELFC